MCDEVKDLLEELRVNQVEDDVDEDLEDDFEEDIDEEEEN